MKLKPKMRDYLINTIAASPLLPNRIRLFLYKFYGCTIGKCSISPRCFFGGNNISIGDDSFINWNCFLDNSGKIEIGNNTYIGMGTYLCTSTHEIGNSKKRAGRDYGKDIKIGNGCWIGAKALILPGVTIGDGCIIGGGGVVTNDIPANSLAVGVPAKVIKTLDD